MEPASSTTALRLPQAADATPAQWLFLAEWFTCLENNGVSLTHHSQRDNIRVGESEMENESWLQLPLSHALLTNAHEEDENGEFYDVANADPEWPTDPQVLQRLGLLRDAIVLTSLVGKTDYGGWLAMMTQFAGLEIPRRFKNTICASGQAKRLPVQFEFFLREEHNLRFLKWSTCFGHILGDINHSENWYRDLDHVRRELTKSGFVWTDFEPTPIKLEWSIDSLPAQEVSRRLKGIVKGIKHTQRLDEQAHHGDKSRGTVLRVTTIDVDMRFVTLDGALIESLTSLLQSGVRVSSLALPDMIRASNLPTVDVWCPFVRLLTGVDRDDKGRLASARHIEIPGSYADSLHFALFCSALVYANGVDKLCLLCEAYEHSLGEDDAPSRLHAWRWLAFALFSKTSTTSVKKFSIRGEVLLPDDVAAIKEVLDSANPFEVLGASFIGDGLNTSSLSLDNSRSFTTIPPRHELQISSGIHTVTYQTSSELTGELLPGIPESGEHVVFIPGYGLCSRQLSERPDKRSRIQRASERATSSVDSLVLGYSERGEHHPTDLLALLESVGLQLRGLHFLTDTTDATLRRIFELCPNLESIRIERATLSSMDVFDDAYANGIQLSSLHASEVKVPDVPLQDFVRKLAIRNTNKNTAASTLERLCWYFRQDIPSSNETLRLFEDVLATNTTLTHLDGLFIVPTDGQQPIRIALNKLDGQRVPGLSHKQKQKLLAFLGAMDTLSQANSALYVDARVKQLIYEFAFEPRYRHVLWFGSPPRRR